MSRQISCALVIAIALGGLSALAGEAPTREELLEENGRLREKVRLLEEALEGEAGLVNLGRTSLAAVTASSVNGSRTVDNQFYGAVNAFDGGENWVNNINYTYWLAQGASGYVEVRFDKPVSVKEILVENGPPFTAVLHLAKGGERVLESDGRKICLGKAVHGVVRVRLTFPEKGGRSGNLRVDEIRIIGYAPPGEEYEVRRPRIFLTETVARLLAVDRFNRWRQSEAYGAGPRTVEHPDRYETVFRHKGGAAIFRVTVFKEDSRVETETLARWQEIREEAAPVEEE